MTLVIGVSRLTFVVHLVAEVEMISHACVPDTLLGRIAMVFSCDSNLLLSHRRDRTLLSHWHH